jgi:hypothetical protein
MLRAMGFSKGEATPARPASRGAHPSTGSGRAEPVDAFLTPRLKAVLALWCVRMRGHLVAAGVDRLSFAARVPLRARELLSRRLGPWR